MSYKFLYIESKENIKENITTIIEVFQAILTIDKYEIAEDSVIIYYTNAYTTSIKEVILNLVEDIYIDLRVYESREYKDTHNMLEEIPFIKLKIKEIPFHIDNYINNKTILSFNLNKIDNNLKHLVFGNYYNNQEMLKTIKVFLENDQNSSNSAKELYVHRNTLNQRLDKFINETGFNIKKFQDAFLIYHLLK
ncbi:MAG TPA: hypothetical protein GX742_01570 [Acholeplasmataceae bacterium]|nr:hypothetical protein [Acholeplasmataceae bacterium]